MTTLKQKVKLGGNGSFINQLMGNNSTLPKVGEGATIMSYSDRSAYQVTWVSDCGTKCKINPAIMKYVGSGYGDEKYEYQGYREHSYDVAWRRNSWYKIYNVVDFEDDFVESMEGKGLWEDEVRAMGLGELYDEDGRLNVIPSVTKSKKEYEKISIIFGRIDEYRDPSF
jgi:hypothetical protein